MIFNFNLLHAHTRCSGRSAAAILPNGTWYNSRCTQCARSDGTIEGSRRRGGARVCRRRWWIFVPRIGFFFPLIHARIINTGDTPPCNTIHNDVLSLLLSFIPSRVCSVYAFSSSSSCRPLSMVVRHGRTPALFRRACPRTRLCPAQNRPPSPAGRRTGEFDIFFLFKFVVNSLKKIYPKR